MTDQALYVLPVPSDAQVQTGRQLRQQIAASGAVNGGSPAVQQIALDSDQRQLEGQYRGKYAEDMATELEELFASDGIEEIPLYGTTESLGSDRYYVLEQIDAGRVEPQLPDVQEFKGTIRQAGTRSTHWRGTVTSPTDVTNDFGTATTEYIGVPATTSNVRWYDHISESTEAASLVTTRSAELGDVEIYDAAASSFADPRLIYDLGYSDEGDVDVVTWDNKGASSKTDSNGIVQWQRVFDSGHEFAGDVLVSNGLLRLTFDVPNESLTAEEWDATNSVWSSVSLGTSDWVLADMELTGLMLARVDAQVLFRNTADGSKFTLNMSLKRGYLDAQWTVPPGESGPTPSGLQTKLDPIANGSTRDPQEAKTLVERQEVRK